MRKTLTGLLLSAAGFGLIYVGYQRHQSVGESVGRFFLGSSSDETKLLLLGGAVCALAGLGLLGFARIGKGKKA